MTERAKIAQNKPCLVPLTEGKRYAWCACGLSKTQPFCDGAHKGTGFDPIVFTADKTAEVLLCACKQSQAAPYCDGAHNQLDDTYEEASEEEIAALANATWVEQDSNGKAVLDGGAYVLTIDPNKNEHKATLAHQPLISAADGAKHLSLHYFTAGNFVVGSGKSPWRAHNGADTVLFILSGKGHVHIEDKAFDIEPEVGVYVKAGEAFCFEAEDKTTTITAVAAICPQGGSVTWPDAPNNIFDARYPVRSVGVDPAKRNPMADRFFQILVDSAVGSTEVTQFIGEVPKSRAAMHRHLYEEAIVVLSGAGVMWTENKRTLVSTGDVIFLPARQAHSLECTDRGGLRLMGVFYPAGSPAINY